MRLRQRLQDGDRSDPRIVILDSLKGSLSYPGWRGDAAQAEKWRGMLSFGVGNLWDIEDVVAKMRRKQEVHVAHPPSLVSAAFLSGACLLVLTLFLPRETAIAQKRPYHASGQR